MRGRILMREIAYEFPSGYFEAKPAQVVSFDEVRMVVAPDTMPLKLADALNERGIPYTTYDGTSSDRKAKLNAVEGVQFSPRNYKQVDPKGLLTSAEKYQLERNWYGYKMSGNVR